MNQSPHWPGVGRYVGLVIDKNTFNDLKFDQFSFTTKFDGYIITVEEFIDKYVDDKDWQVKRVYQDELDYLNGETK